MKNKIINIIFKIIKITFINIIILLILLVISDFLIFKFDRKFQNEGEEFRYILKKPYIWIEKISFKDKENIDEYKRRFVGLEYKNKKPIIIFGCSFAYGDGLKYNQTFGYKLSHYLKIPVYNRAMSGGGLQTAYAQTLSQDFYNEVQPSDNVIYIMIWDHYRRLQGDVFSIFLNEFYPHYKLKNGNLVIENYNNYILNFFRSSYTIRKIFKLYVQDYYVENEKNADKLTDEVLLYFIKIRENMEKQWNNKINFTVIFYDDFKYLDLLKSKLEKNNFNTIMCTKLTNENLDERKYRVPDGVPGHPSEKAWNLLTPLIVESLNL